MVSASFRGPGTRFSVPFAGRLGYRSPRPSGRDRAGSRAGHHHRAHRYHRHPDRDGRARRRARLVPGPPGTAAATLTGQLTGAGTRIDAGPHPRRHVHPRPARPRPLPHQRPPRRATPPPAAPGRPQTPRRPKSSASSPALHTPSPSATGTSTQRSSSPCNSAGSSAVIPAATTSNSPMMPSSRWHPRCRIYPVPSTDIFVAPSADISCRSTATRPGHRRHPPAARDHPPPSPRRLPRAHR